MLFSANTSSINSFNICVLQFFIFLSCIIAVGTNLSQFICIGRFTAVSFQVLGHMKTILVLVLGFFLFGREGLNLQVIFGMILAVIGMLWYGNASSKPGGKERWSYSLPIDKSQKHGLLSESGEHDGKVWSFFLPSSHMLNPKLRAVFGTCSRTEKKLLGVSFFTFVLF